MKANELRIGNWIFDAGDEQKSFQIEQICKDSDGFSGYYVVFRNGSFKSSISSDLIQPIVLTPEILEKCGFDYDASYEVPKVQKGNFILWDGFDGSFSANFGGLTRLDVYVIHLHQLQNLYFALTGEELEVKL